MRRCGLILTLLAAVAVYGAEPAKNADAAPAKDAPATKKEVKAAPAAKKEAKAPAKEEKKCEPKKSPIPWLVPAGAAVLKADERIDVPAEGIRTRADMKVGDKLIFKLVDVSSGDMGKWEVSAVDSAIAKVAEAGRDEGGIFSKATVSFEITAVGAGRTLLELSLKDRRGAPIRMFRCYIEVK